MSKRTPTRSTRGSATMDPDRKVGRKPSPDPPLSGIHSLLPMTSTSKTILTACFSRMTEHKWFSVLIENEQYTTTVAVGMNQTYEHVTALFLHLGYITTDRNKYTLVAKKWENITNDFFGIGKLQVSSIRRKNGRRMFYLCRNTPTYSGPTQQQNHAIKVNFEHEELRVPDRYESRVRNILCNYVRQIQVAYTYCEPTPSPKKSLHDSIEKFTQQSVIPVSIDKYIDRALSLDFTKFPRPSRCNTGIIRIHEGKQAKQSDRLMVLLTVYHWGWKDPKLSYKIHYVLQELHHSKSPTMLDMLIRLHTPR